MPSKNDAMVARGADLWDQLAPDSTMESVPDEEIHLNQLFAHRQPDEALCGEHRSALQHYLSRIPVDVGSWRLAEHCAELIGDSQWQAEARRHIDSLLAYIFRGDRGSQPWKPASILHAWEIPELAIERGHEVRWMRILSLESSRYLLVEASMVDERGQENRYYFDLMDALLRLNVDSEAQIYPADRRSLAFSYLESEAMAGDPLALTGYLYIDLDERQVHALPARRALQDAWDSGMPGGGILLMEMCLGLIDHPCDKGLIESVTHGLIERDIAEGHILRAASMIRTGRPVDDPDVVSAIDRAASLSDRGRMLYYLADVLSEHHPDSSPDRATVVNELFRRSADLGTEAASLRLVVNALAARPDEATLDPSLEAQLEYAADAGLPLALHLKGRLLVDDPEQRMILLLRAAASGLPEAQFYLGALMSQRDDSSIQTKAESWLSKAAAGGSTAAMRLLAQRRLTGISGEIDAEAAANWLFSALEFGDTEAAAWVTALFSVRPTLHAESDSPAREMAAMLALDVGREPAARMIDRVFRRIRPFTEHQNKAHQLFEDLSAEGWAPASLILAERAMDETSVSESGDKAAHWFRRATAQGSIEAHYQLAAHLLYDLDNAPEATASFRAATEHGHVSATNDLAYILCTGEQGVERRPEEGLEIIRELFEEDEVRHPFHFSTLAACQAANGKFESAIRNHEIALSRTKKELPEDTFALQQMRDRMQLYRAGRPYIWNQAPGE